MSLNNQKGMTLVEVLIAGGLLAGLAVAGMTLFKTQNEAQKTVEQNYEVTAALGAIRSILANPEACSFANNLGGLNPNVVTNNLFSTAPRGPGIMKIHNGVSQGRVYAPGAMLPGTSLRVNSYTLTRTGYPGLAANEIMLVISFSRGRGAIKDELTRTLKINFTGNPISSCYAVTSGAMDSIWQIVGAGPDIFYSSGNVGIRHAAPTFPLEVRGASPQASLGDGASGGLRIGDATITKAAGSDLTFNTGLIPATDNVGVLGTTARRWNSLRVGTGVSSFQGSVGIGTATPSFALHVNGATRVDGSLEVRGASPQATLGDGASGGLRIGDATITKASGSEFTFSSGLIPLTDNNAALGTTARRWGSLRVGTGVSSFAGNVGIGIDTPAAGVRLHVNGVTRVDGWIETSGAAGWRNTTYGNGGWYMSDTTWIRSNGGKSVYHDVGIMRTDGTLQVGNAGATLDAINGGNVTLTRTAGNVAIGNITPNQKLHVVGNVRAVGYLYGSDRRWKKDIKTIENPLEKISQFRGVNFTWKETGEKDMGFIAQEVEKVAPELVSDDTEGMKAVKYGNIISIVVEALKELKLKVENLLGLQNEMKTELQRVKAENDELKRRLADQEARLERQEKLMEQLSRK